MTTLKKWNLARQASAPSSSAITGGAEANFVVKVVAKGMRAMLQQRTARLERRLSAILAADVAGYSRIMHHDEEATHSCLTALLADAVEPAIAEHRGHIVKNTGDGFLAEFPSAVEAVRTAIQFQNRIHQLTMDDAEDRRIALRVGINIGDIIVGAQDIFGDGVNIAARIEGVAEPGGICISSSAYDQVRGKVEAEFVDLGEQSLKNIARPVRVYRVQLNGTSLEAAPRSFNNLSTAPERQRGWSRAAAVPRRAVLAGAGSTVALGLGGAVFWPRLLQSTPTVAGTHRTALVIGNAQYRSIPPLSNPVRDADSVSTALEQRGFRVIKVIDADGQQTAEAVTDFERTLSVVGGVGILYYAGRAAYIDGEDILMPVDVKLNSTQTRLEGGVNLTTLQAQIQAKITRKFVSDGSAVIYSASKGEAADDGPPGKHSPFTTAFLEALTHDEYELGDLFRRIRQTMDKEPSGPTKKQTPYFEDSRSVKFHFSRAETDAAIGALKIVIFDSCRDNPLNFRLVAR
jgi:class 3 adenylate cyclase